MTGLQEDLRALAAQVHVQTLDLPALRALAVARRRRRRLPVLAALCAVVVAVPVLLQVREDRLSSVARPEPVAEPLRVAVTSATLSPGSGLAVSADPAPVEVGEVARLTLTWSTLAAGVVAPRPRTQQEVPAARGRGVMGITDGRCAHWLDDGTLQANSCPAETDRPLAPGERAVTDLYVYPRVRTGRLAAGSYRVVVPIGDTGGTLRLDLTVSGAQIPAAHLTGQVIATHGRGLTGASAGEVPAQVVLTGVSDHRSRQVESATGSFGLDLPGGSYDVTARIVDGTCGTTRVFVAVGSTTQVRVDCKDGISTDTVAGEGPRLLAAADEQAQRAGGRAGRVTAARTTLDEAIRSRGADPGGTPDEDAWLLEIGPGSYACTATCFTVSEPVSGRYLWLILRATDLSTVSLGVTQEPGGAFPGTVLLRG